MVPVPGLILLLAGWARGWSVRRRETAHWLLMMLACWGSVVLQRKFFPYHHLQMIPVLTWGIALPLSSRQTPSEPGGAGVPWLKTWVVPVFAALLAVAGVQYLQASLSSLKAYGRRAKFDQANDIPDPTGTRKAQREAALMIRQTTRPGDRIFVWGDAPMIYPISGRLMAGRHPHLMAIVPPWGGAARLTPVLEQLARERPKVIVVCPDPLWWRNYTTPKELLEEFPDMKRFLASSYRLVRTIDGYDLWASAE